VPGKKVRREKQIPRCARDDNGRSGCQQSGEFEVHGRAKKDGDVKSPPREPEKNRTKI